MEQIYEIGKNIRGLIKYYAKNDTETNMKKNLTYEKLMLPHKESKKEKAIEEK